MAVRPIVLLGDPVLRQQAAEVTVFDDELKRLVEDMFDTMDDAPGGGLAAPQVGESLAVFTFDSGEVRGHVVNPVVQVGTTTEVDQEGCLSLPGLWAMRERAYEATVTGVDVEGNPVSYCGEGYLARAFQHETDHLHGILFHDALEGVEREEFEAQFVLQPWAVGLTLDS